MEETETNTANSKNKNTGNNSSPNPYMIPAAIIIAGLLVSLGLYFSGQNSDKGTGAQLANNSNEVFEEEPLVAGDVREVTSKDHIRGDLSAPVKIIEYVDLECPFCQRFHGTMVDIMKEYGEKVAWVYRHGDSVHEKTVAEGMAAECAAELGGNDAFWKFVDRMFEISPANDGFNLNNLPDVAQYAGVNRSAFQECYDSGRYEEKVKNDFLDQRSAGGFGTPHSIVLAPNGKMFPISGAQPYNTVKQTIDLALQETE